ncbi:MAG TPA: hypothetical protein VNZ22_05815 [Bacillota bacterium]|nr:hypothetical protein [Bacillota bacterium]
MKEPVYRKEAGGLLPLSFPQHRNLRIFSLVLLILLLAGAWGGRHKLVKAYAAVDQVRRIRRLHLFTPVPAGRSQSQPGVLAEVRFLADLAEFRARSDQRSQQFAPQLQPLVQELTRRQAAGENLAYSARIYREIRWRVSFTPDLSATQARIADLKASLSPPLDQRLAEQQSPEDGSWGAGYSVWFLKLYGTVNDALSAGAAPRYPLSFLDRINSPEKLTNYLAALVVDDFLQTGVATRMEADESVSLLGRLLCGDVQCPYSFHPDLKGAYLQFIDQWQSPETGCWGNLFVARDGTLWRMDDVGMTFHIVSRLKANTKHLDKITRRILQLSTVDFPAGIRVNGHYENHLNWDVVRILRYAWPTLDAATRQAAQAELKRMLTWCLSQSLQADGSFKVSDLDDTYADAMQYGVSFLKDIGYFSEQERFWTDEAFPESAAIHARILRRLQSPRAKAQEPK